MKYKNGLKEIKNKKRSVLNEQHSLGNTAVWQEVCQALIKEPAGTHLISRRNIAPCERYGGLTGAVVQCEES